MANKIEKTGNGQAAASESRSKVRASKEKARKAIERVRVGLVSIEAASHDLYRYDAQESHRLHQLAHGLDEIMRSYFLGQSGRTKLYQLEGCEPSCPRCGNANAMLHRCEPLRDGQLEPDKSGTERPYIDTLTCRDCGYRVYERDTVIIKG